MAILSDGSYLTHRTGASDLTHLNNYFWPLAFSGMVNYGRPGRGRAAGATAPRIAGKCRLSPPQPRAHEQRAGPGHDRQSHDLPPIHAKNIAAIRPEAKRQLC